MAIGEGCGSFVNNCELAKLSFEQLFRKFLLVDDGTGCAGLKVVTSNDVLNQTLEAYRKTDLGITDQAVKSEAGRLLGWNIINPNDEPVYLKFYDAAVGDVTVGTTVPVLTLQIPANGSIYQEPNCVQQIFSTAIVIAATKLLADTDTTAPDTAIQVNIKYN